MLKKNDPRVIRTRRFLREALIELVAEKGYENVMIQDITDRATLNRATFYLHYKDKDDLLSDCAKELFEDLWSRGRGSENVALLPDPARIKSTMYVPIFEHLAEYADFYRAVLGVKGAPAFIEMMHHYSSEAVREQWRDRMMEADPILADILLQFNFSGIQGIVSWWLKNDMPHSPEAMSRYLTTIVSQSMLHFMQQPGIPAEEKYGTPPGSDIVGELSL